MEPRERFLEAEIERWRTKAADFEAAFCRGATKSAELTKQVAELTRERDRLLDAIKEHHGQKADDRCIEDDDRLYAAAGLPPCDRRVGCKLAMLKNCERFIDRRCEEGGWPSYVELERERDRLKKKSERFRQSADAWYQACSRAGKTNIELCEERDRLQEQLNAAQDELQERRSFIEDLTARLNEANIEAAEWKTQYESLTKTVSVDPAPEEKVRRTVPITDHGGNKYIRTINAAVGVGSVKVDVYAVLTAFGVTCPATQHALKKLLCAGLRGKASKAQDLFESIDAIHRAIEIAQDAEV